MGTTKVYPNNQTVIPSKIRKEFNITKDTIVSWNIDSDNVVILTFESKKPKVSDLIALGNSKQQTNAVELKRGLYK